MSENFRSRTPSLLRSSNMSQRPRNGTSRLYDPRLLNQYYSKTPQHCPSYPPLVSRRRTFTSNALRTFMETKVKDHQRVCKLLGLVKAKPKPKRLLKREISVQTGNSLFTCSTNSQDLLRQTVPSCHAVNRMCNNLRASIIHRSTLPILSHPSPYPGLDRAVDHKEPPSKLHYTDINDVLSFQCSFCKTCSCRTADKDDVSTDYWIPALKSPLTNETTDSWHTELTTQCQEVGSTNLSY
ncbi:uncharacterized protein DEA37_0001911 [Paragonimus westermani]|uniref:Uncharacterized protein n=1 Tax=Paragonimus westermani TaxID=34504 RepID=A0A5J4NND0_9TREM|nr:uncharacterized protein DEA37_0001911 [Paragonimus westermani]